MGLEMYTYVWGPHNGIHTHNPYYRCATELPLMSAPVLWRVSMTLEDAVETTHQAASLNALTYIL
jgi:hypothetical protein